MDRLTGVETKLAVLMALVGLNIAMTATLLVKTFQ
jgi:hypothetical protein